MSITDLTSVYTRGGTQAQRTSKKPLIINKILNTHAASCNVHTGKVKIGGGGGGGRGGGGVGLSYLDDEPHPLHPITFPH